MNDINKRVEVAIDDSINKMMSEHGVISTAKLADALIEAGLIFNPETDIRPKIKLPQKTIDTLSKAERVSEISDGYHTFREIYHNRAILFAVVCNQNKELAWKSKLHHDGTMFDGGYFICGINTKQGQFTYHYKLNYWDIFDVKELDNAPEWDGHTAKDIERILSILVLEQEAQAALRGK